MKPARKRNPKSKAEIIDKDDSSSGDDKKDKKGLNADGTSKKKQLSQKEKMKLDDLSDISSDSDLDSDEESKPKPAKPKPKPKKPKKESKDEKKEKEKEKPAKSKKKKQVTLIIRRYS